MDKNASKPGIKTSELWATIGGAAAGFALEDPTLGWIGVSYAALRTLLKIAEVYAPVIQAWIATKTGAPQIPHDAPLGDRPAN